MIGILISAVVLCGSMYMIARHEAEISFPIVLLIIAGVSIVGVVLTFAIGVFALPIILLLLAWALHQFCYLGWGKAFLVTIVYIVVQVAIEAGFRMLTA